MTTKGYAISRVREMVKADNLDSFLTDRLIYSLILKHAKLLIKRKDDTNKLGRYNGLFQWYPGLELEEVSPIKAGCGEINVCCTLMMSKEKLPAILEGSYGPIIRAVTSIDGTTDVTRTYAKMFAKMTQSSTFKYNKTKYYWLSDGYIVFPNVAWPMVDVEAMWEDNIELYSCTNESGCVDRRTDPTNIPDDLFPEIEGMVKKDLFELMQIPQDPVADNKNIVRP